VPAINRFALAAVSAFVCLMSTGCAGQKGSAIPYAAPGLAALDGNTLKRAGTSGFLYVSDAGAGDVQVYDWPNPTNPIATLTGFSEPQGVCSDGKDAYITSTTAATVVEYAGGATKPTRTIVDPNGLPVDCSSDPSSGDLAVANILSKSYGQGSIEIYHKAKGKPIYISSKDIFKMFNIQYDGSGNLWVNGLNAQYSEVFGELPAGSKHIETICPPAPQSEFPSGLAWDGKHILLAGIKSSQSGVYTMKGCKEVGFIPIAGGDTVFFAVDRNRLVSADAGNLDVNIYAYPKGGNPIQTLHGFSQPIGVTIVSSK
jgi:hypothetical protein